MLRTLRRRRRRGFTLIEVLVATFLLVMLFGAAFLALISSQKAVKTARNIDNAQQVATTALETARALGCGLQVGVYGDNTPDRNANCFKALTGTASVTDAPGPDINYTKVVDSVSYNVQFRAIWRQAGSTSGECISGTTSSASVLVRRVILRWTARNKDHIKVVESVEAAPSNDPAFQDPSPRSLIVESTDYTKPITIKATINIPDPNRPGLYISTLNNYQVTHYVDADEEVDAALGGNATTGCAFFPFLSQGVTYSYGGGTINGAGQNFVPDSNIPANPVALPGAPAITLATPGDSSATITFAAPTSDGGAAINYYTVRAYQGTTLATTTVVTSVTPATVTGLANGVPYTFTVSATNLVGEGPQSAASAAVTPRTRPGPPTITGVTSGDQQLVVAFSAPAFDGGSPVTSYTAVATDSLGNETATNSAGSPATIAGLVNGTSYTITVTATNIVGQGAKSSEFGPAVPYTVPDPPTSVTGTPDDSLANLSWTSGSNNGNALIAHEVCVYADDGVSAPTGVTGATCRSTGSPATSYTFTGLTNGTFYKFTAAALNAAGAGGPSLPSIAIKPRTIPGAPRVVTATPADSQGNITWLVPLSDGGAVITDYQVSVFAADGSSPAAGVTGAAVRTVGSDATEFSFTGLSNGTSYSFVVKAINEAGVGPGTTSNVITAATAPNAPTIPRLTPAAGQISMTWSAPLTGGGLLDDYRICVYNPSGGAASGVTGATCRTMGTATATSYIFSGLTNGTAYSFTVAARNPVGWGPESVLSKSATPASVPGAPTISPISPGDNRVTVPFSPPASNGGSSVTSYTATAYLQSTDVPAGSNNCTAPCTQVTITGLAAGQSYYAKVTATNAIGTGPASAASSAALVYTKPGAPLSPSAVAGDGQATVSFGPPASDGSSTVLAYSALSSPGGLSSFCAAPCSSIIVTGLANGTSYTFTVTATNVAGSGPQSVASNAVTPITHPSSPTGLTSATGSNQANLSWNAVSGTPAGPVTGYRLYRAGTQIYQGSSTGYSDTAAPNGTTYSYAVSSYGNGGESPQSSGLSVAPDWYQSVVDTSPFTRPFMHVRLGDPNGTAARYSPGGGNFGAGISYVGSPTLGVTGALAGNADTAVTFNGTSQYVLGQDYSSMNDTDDITLEAWVKPNSLAPAYQTIMAKRSTGTATPWALRLDAGGVIDYFYGSASGYQVKVTAPGAVTAGVWNHVVVTRTGTTIRFYVNGSQVGADQTAAVTPVGNSAPATIGVPLGDAGLTEMFAGSLDEVAFYQMSLTSAQVLAHYRAGSIGTNQNLTATTPTDLTVVGFPTGTGALATWTGVSDSTVDGYRLFRDSGSGPILVCQGFTSCLDNGSVPPAGSVYTIESYNKDGNRSPPSSPVTPVPSNLTAPTATAGSNQVTLNWTAITNTPAFPVSGYKVYRSDSGGPYNYLTTVSGASTVNHTDTTAYNTTAGTTYTYKVATTGANGDSPLSAASPTVIPNWYQDAVQADSPAGYWRLGAPAGSVLVSDASGNGRVAQKAGAAAYGAAGALSGNVNTAITQTGTSQWMTVPDNNAYSISTTGSLSSEIWVKPTAASQTDYILTKDQTGQQEFQLYEVAGVPTLKIFYNSGGSSNTFTFAGGALSTSSYTQLGFTVSGTTVALFRGGGDVSGGGTLGGPPNFNGTSNVLIGASLANGTTSSFRGSIDEAAIYPSALSPTRFLVHGRTGTLGSDQNLTSTTPTGLAATSSQSNAVPVSWNAVADATIDGYRVTRTGGTSCGVVYEGSATSFTDNATTNPQCPPANAETYTYTVQSYNKDGHLSAASSGVTATPSPTPTGVSATSNANTQSNVSWTAPSSDGGSAITDYAVSVFASDGTSAATGVTGATTRNVGSATTTLTFTGLTNGTAYTFKVAAINAIGTGTQSAVSNVATPSTVPGAPTIGTATPLNNSQASVTFTAPGSNGGAAITSYTVTSSPGGLTASGASSPLTVSGLSANTAYTFTVTATNASGTGAASAASNSATTAPAPPTGTSATASGTAQSATTNWSASTGATYYDVYRNPSGTIVGSPTGLTYTNTGLVAATNYAYSIRACNAASVCSGYVSLGSTVTTVNAYATAVLADSPWLWYRHAPNGGTTVVADSSGNARNGTYSNTTASGYSGPLVRTPSYSAATVFGAHHNTSFANLPPIQGTSNYTVEAWVNTATLGQWQAIYSEGTNTTTGNLLQFLLTPNGALLWGFWADDVQTANNVIAANNTWYHVAATYTGSTKTVKIYVNGTQVLSQATANTYQSINWYGTFGRRQVIVFPTLYIDDLPWQGYMAETTFYSSALSAARVQAHYNAGVTP